MRTELDTSKVDLIIKSCFQEVILPYYQNLKEHDIDTKTSPADFVTQADIKAEAFLEDHLPPLLPGSVFIGEEGVSRGDHTLEALSTSFQQPVWIVDPVDGTANFVKGTPNFAVMVACIIDAAVRYSWIYSPIEDILYTAQKGAGAFANGVRLHMTDDPLTVSDMKAHVSLRYFPKTLRQELKPRSKTLASCSPIGAASHEYANVATGGTDIAVYSRLAPWDHLPGSLIVEEAGGYIAKWDGKPYAIGDMYAPLIVARSKACWTMAYDALFAGLDMSATPP